MQLAILAKGKARSGSEKILVSAPENKSRVAEALKPKPEGALLQLGAKHTDYIVGSDYTRQLILLIDDG